MFGIGSTEFLVILLVALVVLGPKSLASVSRTLGKAMGEFRRVSTDFQRTLNAEVEQEEHLKRKQEAEKEAAYQQQIDDLQYEIDFLKDQLQIEIPPRETEEEAE